MSATHSGARQWRVACPECGPAKQSTDKRMHSQVSDANLSYFIDEGRVDVSREALRRRFEAADGTLVVCNNCGHIREVEA